MRVFKGEHWQEKRRQFTRIVEVITVRADRIRIKTVVTRLGDKPGSTGRVTWVRRDRFGREYELLGGHCHECQLKRGAVMPEDGLRGITVSMGTCASCLNTNAGLVPDCDYHWPKEGKRALWD